jgi:hypothetical protein
VGRPHGQGRARLVHRFRFRGQRRSLGAPGSDPLIEVPHFVAGERTLRGIKARAEAHAAAAGSPPGSTPP